jgi:hypothetical protein
MSDEKRGTPKRKGLKKTSDDKRGTLKYKRLRNKTCDEKRDTPKHKGLRKKYLWWKKKFKKGSPH